MSIDLQNGKFDHLRVYLRQSIDRGLLLQEEMQVTLARFKMFVNLPPSFSIIRILEEPKQVRFW